MTRRPPDVGDHRHLPGRGQGGDAHDLGEPAGHGQVGLGHVEGVPLVEGPEGPDAAHGLASHHRQPERPGHVGVPVDVVGGHGLLQPGEALGLQLTPGLDGRTDGVALVGVGQQDHSGPTTLRTAEAARPSASGSTPTFIFMARNPGARMRSDSRR